MAGRRERHFGRELRRLAAGLVLYCGLLGAIGYGAFAAITEPRLLSWLAPGRALDMLPAKAPAGDKPHASLPPKLRGAMAE
ncbi:MAG: hypothetical protein IT564_09400 [Rhodospirillales bacterium]|nr:hypothetical protein [Rhodospirillales bacterium]